MTLPVRLDLGASGGLPNHQRAGQAMHARQALAADHGDKALPGLTAEHLQIHVDARQGRAARGGHYLPIVEADNGDIARHLEAYFAQCIGRPARDLVIAAEQRIGAEGDAIEQSCNGFSPPGLRPGAAEAEPWCGASPAASSACT